MAKSLMNLRVSKVSYDSIREVAEGTTPGHISMVNPTGTAEAAPYLPRIIANGTLNLDDVCRLVANVEGCTFEQARLYWGTMIELVADVLTGGEYTDVEFGYWRFSLQVTGSVPYANAPLGPDNVVYIAIYPSAELQRVAASIETKPNIAQIPFKVSEVFSAAHVMGEAKAGTKMLIMGERLTMGGTGEKVELVGPTGTVYALTDATEEDDLPTRIRATVPANVPAGKKYVLHVTAFGVGQDTLNIVEKANIRILAADAPLTPTVSSVKSEGAAEGTVKPNTATTVVGTNLTGATAKITGTLSDETEVNWPLTLTDATATGFKFTCNQSTGGLAPNNFKLVVTTAAGSVEHAISWSE